MRSGFFMQRISRFFLLAVGLLVIIPGIALARPGDSQERPPALPGGMLARWAMDSEVGTTSLLDTSGNNRHGTIHGATWTAGKTGSGLLFDGNDDYVALPHDWATSSGSVAAWVKTTDWDGVVFAEGSGTANDPYFMLLVKEGRAAIYRDGLLGRALGNTNIRDGQWHFIVWTQVGAPGGLRIYVDGRLETLTWVEGEDDGGWFDDCVGDNYALGLLNRPAPYGPYSGVLDAVTVYDHALSPLDVRRLYTEGSLIAGYDLEEGSGGIAHDHSGSGRDGTIDGPQWQGGWWGQALYFDRYQDRVLVPHDFDPGQGSVSAWINTWYEAAVVFAEGNTAASDPYYMLLVDHGRAGIYRDSYLGQGQGQTRIDNSQWHYVVWTQTGVPGGLHIYVDGREETITWEYGSDDGGWFDDCAGDNYAIGELYRPQPFATFVGHIEEVHVYDRALTAEEVMALYREYVMYLPALAR